MLAAFFTTLALTGIAHAQYYATSAPGYTLSAPPAGQALLLGRGDALAQSAANCLGLSVDGVLKVQGGMSRYIEFDRGADYEHPRLKESVLNGKSKAASAAAPPAYNVKGNPLYLALGTTKAKDGDYTDYVVVSFTADSGGAISECSRFSLGAQYCGGIYVLDLNADGLSEVVAPYATGAGSGGGIEVRALQPTGKLAWFGNDELDSTLFSASGYCNLLDYDGDGDWEIETTAPVLCSACGYNWNDLYTFDKDGWNWEVGSDKFPAYYKPEQDFYRALNAAVVKLAANPAAYKYSGKAIEAQYAVQIGAQWYSLDPFISESKPDRTWVNALASLVSGWK